MTDMLLATAASAVRQVDAALLAQIRAAQSYDAIRHIDVPTAALETSLAIGTFNLHMLGRAHVWGEVASEPRQTAFPRLARIVFEGKVEALPFDEAIAFFRSKVNLPAEDFYALADAARLKAFTVSVSAEDTIIQSIRDIVEMALAEGLTLPEFQAQAEDVLSRAGVSAVNPWYLETVYRTNLQTSYQVGRWQQMQDPYVKSRRPYVRYISARLPTSRPSHVEKHGLVYPQDHAFWDKFAPPNGFNCYCSTMSISEDLLNRRGWTVSTTMQFRYPEPDEGFGYNPGTFEAL